MLRPNQPLKPWEIAARPDLVGEKPAGPCRREGKWREALCYGDLAQNANISRINKLADSQRKTNPMTISVALSMRYTRFRTVF